MNGVGGIIRAADKNKHRYSQGDYCLCKVLTVSERTYLLTTNEEGLGVIDVEAFQKALAK